MGGRDAGFIILVRSAIPHRSNDEDHLGLSVLTKAKRWCHEDEYRIVLPGVPESQLVVPHNGPGSVPMGRYLKVPSESLLGAIFGNRGQYSRLQASSVTDPRALAHPAIFQSRYASPE